MICKLTRMLQTKALYAVSIYRAAGFTSIWIIKSFGEDGVQYGLEYSSVTLLLLLLLLLMYGKFSVFL